MNNDLLNELSVFFPAYNEEASIGETIQDALKYVPLVAKKYEIIVVNDGSHDKTAEIVEEYAKKNPHIRLISHTQNKGYGAAVKTGLNAAKYAWVFFTDADRQFHFSELPAFVAQRDRADVIVGFRRKRRDPLPRIILAQIFLKYWNFLLFGLWMKDVDCAFKLFPTKIYKKLRLTTESAITVTELMVKMKTAGYAIYQTPVTHFPRRKGLQTGSNPQVILRALRESFLLREQLAI